MTSGPNHKSALVIFMYAFVTHEMPPPSQPQATGSPEVEPAPHLTENDPSAETRK
jgi:hypothetical protein